MTLVSLTFPEIDRTNAKTSPEQLRAHLQEAVTLHTMMFEKLLFDAQELPLELCELFEDVANAYLEFSERISVQHMTKEP